MTWYQHSTIQFQPFAHREGGPVPNPLEILKLPKIGPPSLAKKYPSPYPPPKKKNFWNSAYHLTKFWHRSHPSIHTPPLSTSDKCRMLTHGSNDIDTVNSMSVPNSSNIQLIHWQKIKTRLIIIAKLTYFIPYNKWPFYFKKPTKDVIKLTHG